MRDLSLHILDLIENSIRAGATAINITIAHEPVTDTLTITIEDNGPGLLVPAHVAVDPFYTTKPAKKVGLGLSLFQAAAEQAGGSLHIERSSLGGTAVRATMKASHVDRKPLGDLAATLSSVVCTNPDIRLTCCFKSGERESTVVAPQVLGGIPDSRHCGLALARRVSEQVKAALESVRLGD